MEKLRQDISIGKNLKRLRNDCNFTQEQVAAKLQLLGSSTTRSIYSRYETGELNIKISDLILLTEIFKCEYNDFFNEIRKN
ncbi:helix-turn-helix domain-containing protein [Anaerotignum sp. MB30-C6]|uniref:helix-turn-helix domain-containing protein n=1 Tax=Anaerotignum sp. MB30-C6 TaxID=3070814 RepID=UPI0027DE75D6|nr:helix-turn-helix transcriptional regulator [Anaerotignum sp. MB30-C6]WMI81646.1 helix-turn-helix transcriptional regulator [Anaerotignum sp. MB30-C6]